MNQEATKSDMEQETASKLWPEYVKAVYYHFAYLTYTQSKSCEMNAIVGYFEHPLVLHFFGQSLYIHKYPLFFGFPSHLGHHRTLSRVPCAIQKVLISYLINTDICFIHIHTVLQSSIHSSSSSLSDLILWIYHFHCITKGIWFMSYWMA